MKILGIETSCDETAASVLEFTKGKIRILSNIVSSQVKIHAKYGGIIPEVAAREHILKIIPIIELALNKANAKFQEINAIAVVSGPGLITSLIIGLETAKTLAFVFKKPLISVNHLEAHIYSNWLTNKKIQFPVLNLLVSGGHTELILMENHGQFKKIGQTLDDAAGECFDKVAKLLKIGYPGGPIIEKMARQGNKNAFELPRPMIDSKDFNFSFSGLKTAVLYSIRDNKSVLKNKKDYCASFQKAAVDVLVYKTIKAAKLFKVRTVALSGGVSANQKLRNELKNQTNKRLLKTAFISPALNYSTDNAAMVAVCGYFHYLKKYFIPWHKIKVDPNWELG
jgi:N6-L-threonylcarbamoyladenine synthase